MPSHVPKYEFSIIIPTRNRPDALARLLLGISQWNYPSGGFEVIVVNDGGEELPMLPLAKYLSTPSQGPAVARNAGAAAAQGKFLFFLDDDCQPDPDCLRLLHAAAELRPEAALGGETVNGIPESVCASASHQVWLHLMAAEPAFLPSNALCVPARLFRSIGGFNERFPLAAGEDRDFCQRWRAHGYAVHQVSGLRILHFHRMSFVGFCRQQVGYGRGARRLMGRFRRRPLSFYVTLLARPFRSESLHRALPIAGLLAISQVLTLTGFALERGSA